MSFPINSYDMFISFSPMISPPTTNRANESRAKLAWTMPSAADFAGKKSRPYAFSNGAAQRLSANRPEAHISKRGKLLFEVTPLTLAELLPHLDWLASLPTVPVRLSKINRQHALPADFSEVPFETFIICDNLYKGYLQMQNDDLLDQLGATLYGKAMTFKPYERISIFYWFAALKDTFSRKFPDFFQPISAFTGGNLLGSSAPSVEDAMNSQIRALTKGDATKEKEVLALDTHRALTELNAQAREYKELNAKTASK